MPRPLPPDVVAKAGGSEADAVRDHILDAAHRVIAGQGLAAASTRAVAVEAGIGAGTVYNYFDNRVTLLARAIVRRVGTLAAPLGRFADRAGQGTVRGNLRQLVKVSGTVLDEMVPLFAAAFSDVELMDALRRELAADASLRNPGTFAERYLVAERELGRIAADADCRAAAATIVSLCHDRAFHRFLGGRPGAPRSLDAEIDLVCRALTAP